MDRNRRKPRGQMAALVVAAIVLFVMAGAYSVGKDMALRDNHQCSAP